VREREGERQGDPEETLAELTESNQLLQRGLCVAEAAQASDSNRQQIRVPILLI
jgi:hypothetical protein